MTKRIKGFKIHRSADGQYYFTVSNRKITGDGETIKTKTNVIKSCMYHFNSVVGVKKWIPTDKSHRDKFYKLHIEDLT